MRIKIPKKGHEVMSAAKARIIAHLIADGCVYKTNHDYVIKYEVIDEDLLEQFEKDMVSIYGLKLYRGLNKSGKTENQIPFLRLRSKLAYNDLMNYCNYYSDRWIVPNEILNSSNEVIIEFLRAFFDDEGTVISSKTYTEVRLYSINLRGLLQIKELVEKLGINLKLRKGYGKKRNVFALVTNNLGLFERKIGFNSIRKKAKLRRIIEGKKCPRIPAAGVEPATFRYQLSVFHP